MRVSDFDFVLPESLIALEPAPRGHARLLCVHTDRFEDRFVRDLPSLLRPGDLLVLNDTKVIPAQLKGLRPAREEGGAQARQPVEIDVMLHMRLAPAPGRARWRAFLRPAKRLKPGDALDFGGGLTAVVEKRQEAEASLLFNCDGADFDAALARAGAPPLPPYIARKRAPRPEDASDYQTVYAEHAGSVAAPTAGLHFTEDLFAALDAAGVRRTSITLHVGAGTFLPVTAEDTSDHVMHAEWGDVPSDAAEDINETKASGGRVIAVGTTALRLIESAVRDEKTGRVGKFVGSTAIFITPGYRFQVADMLLTNFHLPRSTLFMLVSAFSGLDTMKAAYAHAIESGYRFYSFGDACLLEPGAKVRR